MGTKKVVRITVGQLIDQLKVFERDSEVIFGGDDSLTFYRTKGRGEGLVQIEFNEQVSKGEIVSFDEN
jgi:hypothetical protein